MNEGNQERSSNSKALFKREERLVIGRLKIEQIIQLQK
jgi:hypothetical protein